MVENRTNDILERIYEHPAPFSEEEYQKVMSSVSILTNRQRELLNKWLYTDWSMKKIAAVKGVTDKSARETIFGRRSLEKGISGAIPKIKHYISTGRCKSHKRSVSVNILCLLNKKEMELAGNYILQLEPKHSFVLYLFLNGLSVKEISMKINKPLRTVYRMMEIIRSELELLTNLPLTERYKNKKMLSANYSAQRSKHEEA